MKISKEDGSENKKRIIDFFPNLLLQSHPGQSAAFTGRRGADQERADPGAGGGHPEAAGAASAPSEPHAAAHRAAPGGDSGRVREPAVRAFHGTTATDALRTAGASISAASASTPAR